MAFLEPCLYVTECIKKYILLLISIRGAPQKCKSQPAVNSVHVQRIPTICLISQHSESDFVKVITIPVAAVAGMAKAAQRQDEKNYDQDSCYRVRFRVKPTRSLASAMS